MSDYITTREYAELHGLNIETVKARIKRKQIPVVRFGNAVMLDRNTPWEERKKTGKPTKAAKALAEVDSKIYHVEIRKAYYVVVCDNSGKELVSDFTFLSKAEAEAIGRKMKKEIENKGE